MKTALLTFKKPSSPVDTEYLKEVTDIFSGGGINMNSLDVLPCDDPYGFKTRFSFLRDTADNLVLIAGVEEFNLKEIIAEVMNTEFAENDNALAFAGSAGEEFSPDCAMLPLNATLIPNRYGAFQGFMTEDEEFSLVVLPDKIKQLERMCKDYVLPYFATKYKINKEKFIFKYFGDKETLARAVKEAATLCEKEVVTEIKTVNGDSRVSLTFAEENPSLTLAAKRYIIKEIGKNVYAESDVSLEERLFDLLKLRRVRISVAESFTGGRVAAAIIKNSGVSAYLKEGVVAYSNESKKERLGVKDADLKSVGAVSAKVAYQMAAGLLLKGDCDLALSTTGIAGPDSDGTDKPVGLAYIGVGMKDGVHVYKYEFKGDREQITETAKNTALFLAINKLKNL